MSENCEKRVLLINGSPRDNGNTFTALSEWGFGSLRPFKQVFHDVEYASCKFAILEHGIRSDSWTGSTGRGGYADDADTCPQHGLDDSQAQCHRGGTSGVGESVENKLHQIVMSLLPG